MFCVCVCLLVIVGNGLPHLKFIAYMIRTHGAHSVQGKSSTQGARRRPIVSAHRRTRQGDVVKVDPYVVALGTDVVDEQHHVEEVREENNTSKPKLKSNTSHSLK